MKRKKIKHNGYALLCVMFVITVLTLAVGSMVQVGQQRAFSAKRLTNDIKAASYSEAAIGLSTAVLIEDFENASDDSNFQLETATNGGGQAALRSTGNGLYSLVLGNDGGDGSTGGSSGVKSDYDDGSFTVTLTQISNRYVIVNAKGEHGDVIHESEVLFEDMNANEQSSSTPNSDAWENTIYAANTMNIGGNGDIDGSLHSNGQLWLHGNCTLPGPVDMSSATKIRINGNVESDGIFTAPSFKISGNKESDATFNQQAVAQQAFPDYDLTELYNEAVNNGTVINGNKTYNNDKSWSGGSVIWVKGNLKLKGNATLQGGSIIIAEGNIQLNGNCDATSGEGNTFISRDSYIKISGNAEVKGLLYAPGDITLNGNVDLQGQIVSGEDVNINGNVGVIGYEYAGPPTDDGDAPQDIQVSAWQK